MSVVGHKLFQLKRRLGREIPKGGYAPYDAMNRDLAPMARLAHNSWSVQWHPVVREILERMGAIDPELENPDEAIT